jgi:ABC-type multidrug transport system ATPase subunit
MFDRIVVMDKGEIKEVGTYQELSANKNGFFAKLLENQWEQFIMNFQLSYDYKTFQVLGFTGWYTKRWGWLGSLLQRGQAEASVHALFELSIHQRNTTYRSD